ncbi:MAG TPA: nickel transporter [Steroidobacter sp.]|uniref:HoxN/HupN/NixA family nickel/cobalt transporter n=1 Tax=Steroidobacter sp. TaxID=1978227 RepID=UPI002ED8AF74
MESLNHSSWNSIFLLAFLIGVRHGFDADHLATIDGLTRWGVQRRTKLAGWFGSLFSAGHGMIVIGIAVVATLTASQWRAPDALSLSGAFISIGIMLLLGVMNLHAVLRTPAHQTVELRGLKGRWLGRIVRTEHPLLILGVGMMFALSLDTVSLAALFALTAQRFDGVSDAVLLGLVFTSGMWLADGTNGLWIARLLRRADATALIASRLLGAAVGGLSLLVAAFGIAKLAFPAVDRWSEGRELMLGLGVVVLPTVFFILAQRLARSELTASRTVD